VIELNQHAFARLKMLWGGSGEHISIAALTNRWSPVMTKLKTKTVNDFSRCLDPLDMDATVIAVIEMSQSSWLVAGIVPGVERQPLKKLAIDEHALLNLLNRWRAEAEKQGRRITRIAVAFEAGHDGFWLARWLADLMRIFAKELVDLRPDVILSEEPGAVPGRERRTRKFLAG
jgi:hypothetical protein